MKTLYWHRVTGGDGSAFHAGRFESVAMRGREQHDHADFSEVFYLECGELVHVASRRRVRLAAGALVFVRPSDPHGFASLPGVAYAKTNIAFPQAAVRALRRRHPAAVAACFPPGSAPCGMVQVRAERMGAVAELFRAARQAPRTGFELEWFLLSVMREAELARRSAEAAVVRPAWLSRALTLLARPEHFRQGTRHFAALAGHSPEHVAREVRRLLGSTPTELINRARIDHAAARLATTPEKVIGIALESGFNNLGHFYQEFRKRHRATPRAYRLRHTATIPAARGRP
jgi:AraC family cel operon transcriptional repressor